MVLSRFERHDSHITGRHIRGTAIGIDRFEAKVPVFRLDQKAIFFCVFKITVQQEMDFKAMSRQKCAVVPTHRTGADNCEFPNSSLSKRLSVLGAQPDTDEYRLIDC